MAQRNIEVRPMAGALGAEIEGVDVAALDDATLAQLRAALVAHGVVVLRD